MDKTDVHRPPPACPPVCSRVFYPGTSTISGEEVVVKSESVKVKHPQLEYESNIYPTLAGDVGVPFVRWLSTECDYNVRR